MSDKESAKALSQALIKQLRRAGDLTDPQMVAAFEAVPRHLFLPDSPLEQAYADEAIPVKEDEYGMVVSSSSQPSMMISMLRQLDLHPGDNILEIGTGTGYNAAIMQYMVGSLGSVTSVELDMMLTRQAQDNLQRAGAIASRVHVVNGDGAMGYAARASYDRIISTVGVWDIPAAWTRQLKTAGVLVAPVWLNGFQVSSAFELEPDGMLLSTRNIPCGFINMRGAAAGPALYKRMSSSSLTLRADNLENIDSAALHLLLSDDFEISRLSFPLAGFDFCYGFIPYLILNMPKQFAFCLYSVDGGESPYGLAESGFALISQGSACFAAYNGNGAVNCYAGADALLALDEAAKAWDSAGRPQVDQLRIRLIPAEHDKPDVQNGILYPRNDHYLHVWLDSTA